MASYARKVKLKHLALAVCGLICLLVVYLTGLVEYLTARPLSQFSWPLEVDAYSLIRDYKIGRASVQPITKGHFRFNLLPTADRCQEFKLLTVMIKTRVGSPQDRHILRRTWIDALLKREHRYLFLIGRCAEADPDCQGAVQNEQNTHGDLLQGDFIDTYYNNTHKANMALRYVSEICMRSNATQYTLLIDSDYALNVRNLEKYLTSMKTRTGLYGGDVWHHSRPFRLPLHKHYMSLKQYPFSHYPPFVSAGAILLSKDVVESFYILSQYTKPYPFDDVFYGFIARRLKITPTSLTKLLPSYYIPGIDDKAHHQMIGSHRFGNHEEVEYIYKRFGRIE